jgi:two-component system nitrate/nitrite response regulator NarL
LVPPELLGSLLDRLLRRRNEQDAALRLVSQLTPREKVVLALLSDGARNQAIAESLGISPETARTHIQNLLSKLGLHSKLEAASFAIQSGILDEIRGSDPPLHGSSERAPAHGSRRSSS